MGLFDYFKAKPKPEAKRAITYQQGLEAGLISGTFIAHGVDEKAALGISAVWCATKVISESIGKLPFTLYRRKGDGSFKPAKSHPLYDILAVEPNPYVTPAVFWETFVANCLIWGNGFAEITRDGSGRAAELYILHPSAVSIDLTSGVPVYRVNGGPVLQASDILHVPGLSPDSYEGWNLIQTARANLEFSIQADTFGRAYFRNSGNISTFLEHPSSLSDLARQNILKGFQGSSGVENTGKTYLLEEGLKVTRQPLSNEAAQYDETRRYQISEVARLFNISPVKLHELGRATWGNLSSLNTDFWGTSCSPWAVKIEQEVMRKLLLPGERGRYNAEFDADTLLRGDITTRYAAYAVGLTAGFLDPEEVREWEGLPKREITPPVGNVQPGNDLDANEPPEQANDEESDVTE